MTRGQSRPTGPPSRGVSLIEALVALAVTAIGMVGLVGIQANLRGNADVAHQRAEALRLAQQELDRARSYTEVLTPAAPSGRRAFADLVSLPQPVLLPVNAAIPGSAEFTLERRVTDRPGSRHKAVAVDVTWTDRYAIPQRVRLASIVGGVPPELAASLVLPTAGSPARFPGGRHRAVPNDPQLVDLTGNQSALRVDGGTVVLRFDNLSGLVSLCSAAIGAALTSSSVTGCTQPGLSVSGFLRFADPSIPTSAGQALTPTGPIESGWTPSLVRLPLGTVPAGQCAPLRAVAGALQYFCVVPGTAGAASVTPYSAELTWTAPSGLVRVTDTTSSGPSERRVCRYAAATFPLTSVGQPLTNQNYLVIPAGPGGVLNNCPAPETDLHLP